MPSRRIETTTSRTAEITCACRAASSMETDPLYKGDDWIAPLLLPNKLKVLFRFPSARRIMIRVLGPQGIYEWVIARTKYIDSQLLSACSEGVSQVVLLGAGFDTRGIRFQQQIDGRKVFELDAETTQIAKINQYRKRRISIPPNLTFVSLDFEKQSAEIKLRDAGFQMGARTFVIAEGVFQYLKPAAAYATFHFVSNNLGPGSYLVFDYAHASVLRGDGNLYGGKGMTTRLNKFGESWQFGLEGAEISPLLTKYCFKLIDHKSPRDLEEMYFKNEDGKIVGKVNGTQSIVLAQRT